MSQVEYEAEIKIRRNGRIVKWEKALGDTPLDALYAATNDLTRELQSDASEVAKGR